MAGNTRITIETPAENQIVEIAYDGTETLAPPLTLADHLTKQAGKIDFDAVINGDDEEDDGSDQQADSDQDSSESDELDEGLRQWPWDSVRNKLRNALTEMSVLADVITVATKECGGGANKEGRRYMVLDGPVQVETPAQEQRNIVTLVAKKKSLDIPAKILSVGAEHLKNLQSEAKEAAAAASKQSQSTDFHTELLRLRQNWRLKKVSNTILGDLSYRTAGSTFKQSGVFEVVKADEGGSSVAEDSPEGQLKSSLKVNVPSELEGIAYIEVVIAKESIQLAGATLSQPSSLSCAGAAPVHASWQKQLEAAQNVLFCKELFSQLAREAIQLQAPIPHLVVGNQIAATLFPDIQLVISLRHTTGTERNGTLGAESSATGAQGQAKEEARPALPQSSNEHSHVLEHSLHQLLRLQHSRNLNPDHQALSTAAVGIPKRRRLAGPRAADRQSLLEMATQKTLLEQIVQQAQHVVLRMRTMFVLDSMARDCKDPLITCHWGTLSSPTRTSVKVSIVTAGYDTVHRTQFVIHVGENELTVVCKDGRVAQLSHESQELVDFLKLQISQHQINGIQALAKCTGWQVLSSSSNLGCGQVESLGTAAGCLLSNPAGSRRIEVRHSPSQQARVFVWSSLPSEVESPGPDDVAAWTEQAQELKPEDLDGRNLLSKIELLMAALNARAK